MALVCRHHLRPGRCTGGVRSLLGPEINPGVTALPRDAPGSPPSPGATFRVHFTSGRVIDAKADEPGGKQIVLHLFRQLPHRAAREPDLDHADSQQSFRRSRGTTEINMESLDPGPRLVSPLVVSRAPSPAAAATRRNHVSQTASRSALFQHLVKAPPN